MNETKVGEWSDRNMVMDRLRMENAGNMRIDVDYV
jgi:hypothetical protein